MNAPEENKDASGNDGLQWPQISEELAKRIAKVKAHTIYEVVHGSHAYGMATPTSDFDYKGVALIPDLRYFFGHQKFEQQDGGWTDENGLKVDKVVYHLPKFIKMAALCNPNIIEVLWTDEDLIRTITPAGRRLRAARDLFISKKARWSFAGYAVSQLKRIEAHKRWMDNPPEKPERDQFLHKSTVTIGPLGHQWAEGCRVTKILDCEHKPNGEKWVTLEVERFDKSLYESKKKDWENYTKWRSARNEKRAELERQFGIDTKHAAHLVRLLRMGVEIIEEGLVRVRRPDAKELLDIRNGAWTYERLVEYKDEMDAKLDSLYEKSTLQHTPQYAKLEELQMDIIFEALRNANQL